MVLDPVTLSSLVIANGVVFTLLWSVAALRFPDQKNIRYWVAAGIVACIGAVGILVGPENSLTRIAWQVSVVAGYALYAMGVRVFHGARPGLVQAVALVLITTLALFVLHGNRGVTEALALTTAIIPLLATVAFVLAPARRSAGAAIAAVAMSASILGHLVLTVLSLNDGGVPGASGAAMMSYMLLALIYAGTIWNFGFALMMVERFFSMVAVLARTDHLTGAANRREFEDRLATEVSRSETTGHPCCVVMIDVDHFKQLNDRHGHAWGDRSLVHLVQCVNSRIGGTHLLARLGGDEFALLMPHTGIETANETATHIAQTLGQSPVIWNGQRVGYKVSIGVAAWSPGMDAQTLIASADAALYAAKASGRNNVKIAHGPAPAPEPPARPMALTNWVSTSSAR